MEQRMHLVQRHDRVAEPVLSLDGFAGWVMKCVHAVLAGARLKQGAKKQLCILEILSIGAKKQLILVSCGDEQFLVGTGQDSVQTIVHVRPGRTVDLVSPARGFVERP